jgi:hypothetical protein
MAIVLLACCMTGQAELAYHLDPFYFPLSQHSMTSGVLHDGTPVDKNFAFTTNSGQAVSWLKVWRNFRDHPVEWRWYSPDGFVYGRSFGVIPAIDGPEGNWGSNIWSGLAIKGRDPSMMPGTWKVDVIVDYNKELTQYFTISGHEAPCR